MTGDSNDFEPPGDEGTEPDEPGDLGALKQRVRELADDVQRQGAALAALRDEHHDVANQLHELTASDQPPHHHPARWMLYDPPPSAEGSQDPDATPLTTIVGFVQFYNAVYVGLPGSRAVRIPDCWASHPGLAAEIATLTYTWRQANLGPHASPQSAQSWHHHHRPGFAARLAAEWTHAQCHAHGHRSAGAPALRTRFEEPPSTAAAQP